MIFLDFVLDAFLDLKTQNGDFVIDASEGQEIELIVLCEKGEFKQNPLLGVGISKYLKAPLKNTQLLERNLKVNLELDGFQVNDIDFENGIASPTIDAERR